MEMPTLRPPVAPILSPGPPRPRSRASAEPSVSNRPAPKADRPPADLAPALGGSQGSGPSPAHGDEHLTEALTVANDLATRMNVSIAFETSEEGGKVVVAVINRETGELIRKIPPEDLIDRLNRFEGFEGLLTQAKV